MYENMMEEMKARMQPVLDLAETNKKAMEKLAAVQKDSLQDVVAASLEQFKAVAECKEPQAALDLQVKFYKDLEAKMTDTAEKSIAAISEAKEAYVSTVEDAAQKAAAEFEGAVKKASGK